MKELLALIYASLSVVLAAFVFGGAVADNSNASSNYGPNWEGVYNTSMKEIGPAGKWISSSTLSVVWGKAVEYGNISIVDARFFNNSSISWSGDSAWGNGQIWFANGDNRSNYWPDGAASGRVFTGWIEARPGNPNDFRGKDETLHPVGKAKGIGNCPDQTVTCVNCSGGKVCSNGRCQCPGGTTDCSGQCVTVVPCGGCINGKTCINGKCVCPAGTKLCNDQCISVTECCDGCPPWKVCNGGKCVCPPGVKDCPDPMPL
jgi:hypothetical protein